MDVAGKPYVTCSRCGTHVQLHSPNADGSKGEVRTSHAPVAAADAAVAAGGSSAEGQPHVEGGLAPTVAQQAELKDLICPSCKNKIEG